MPELQSTGIDFFDSMIGGIPRGSRTILIGPPGTGKTVFAMQFLWSGLRAGETVSYDVFDRPWPHMRGYFASFGWDLEPFEREGRMIPVQAFRHFEGYPRDRHVRYFSMGEFEEMRRIDLELSRAGITRFVFGDSFEQIFHTLPEEQWYRIEEWTVNWCFHDRVTNFDVVNEVAQKDPLAARMMEFTYLLANNIIRFRTREVRGRMRRELRVERMELVSHPIDWIPFEITTKGIGKLE